MFDLNDDLNDDLNNSENNRNDRALFHNNRLKKNHSIGQNTIKNKYLNSGIYGGYKYNNSDIYGRFISLQFAEDIESPIYTFFNMYQLGQFRLFFPKSLTGPEFLQLVDSIELFGPNSSGYTLFEDCIVPIYLNYQDRFTLSNLPKN